MKQVKIRVETSFEVIVEATQTRAHFDRLVGRPMLSVTSD